MFFIFYNIERFIVLILLREVMKYLLYIIVSVINIYMIMMRCRMRLLCCFCLLLKVFGGNLRYVVININ